MRYVVTGGSGYLGERLVESLAAREETERVLLVDLHPPRKQAANVEYEFMDVRDAQTAQIVLRREGADAIVHMAAIVGRGGDENETRDVNVGGTNSMLAAAAGAGTQHFVLVSSIAGYGGGGGSVEPLDEDAPMRGDPDFDYARDAANADRLTQLWAARNLEQTATIVRPCVVLGPHAANDIVRLWTEKPFAARFAPFDQPIQFLHEDDFTDALVTLLESRGGGVFNLAGEGSMTLGECAGMTGLKRGALAVVRRKRSLGSFPFLTHSPLVSTERLRAVAGWTPTHSGRDAFAAAMRAHGRLVGGEAPAPASELAAVAATQQP
jgi:UDP-glucose 4-epimerase